MAYRLASLLFAVALDRALESAPLFVAIPLLHTDVSACACVHFLSAISDNKQELLDTVAKHRFV